MLIAEDISDIQREITEGKINASEIMMKEELVKEVDNKLQKASSLISLLGDSVQIRYSDEAQKEEAQYVHSGFIARLQGIREDQEALARKEIQPDLETLINYVRRLDSLINDVKTYLKQS
jgi:two-component sensor histidine kinase